MQNFANKNNITQKEPIFAITQPLDTGIINNIRISGKNTIELVRKFIKNKSWHKNRIESHRVYNAYFINPDNKEIIDEIILLVFLSPKSYTREDMIEIQIHQNKFSIRTIIELLLKAGIRYAEPGEFTKRAFLNNRIDLIQAESLDAYLNARNFMFSKNSMKLLHGNLKTILGNLKNTLLKYLSLSEANIDFSHEDIELIDFPDLRKKLKNEILIIEEILENSINYKNANMHPKIAIIGKTNVGKSSIFNLICKKDRALVSHLPGTTRDFISESVIIDNFTLEIVDTAGIRENSSRIEAQGINKTYENILDSDILFLVFDASRKFEIDDHEIINKVRDLPLELIFLFNKTDKKQRLKKTEIEKYLKPKFSFYLSARTKKGIDPLYKYLKEYLSGLIPNQNSIFLNNHRQIKSLEMIHFELNEIIKLIDRECFYDDLIAFHLKEAVHNIYHLFGDDLDNEILDNIFSRFCIGK